MSVKADQAHTNDAPASAGAVRGNRLWTGWSTAQGVITVSCRAVAMMWKTSARSSSDRRALGGAVSGIRGHQPERNPACDRPADHALAITTFVSKATVSPMPSAWRRSRSSVHEVATVDQGAAPAAGIGEGYREAHGPPAADARGSRGQPHPAPGKPGRAHTRIQGKRAPPALRHQRCESLPGGAGSEGRRRPSIATAPLAGPVTTGSVRVRKPGREQDYWASRSLGHTRTAPARCHACGARSRRRHHPDADSRRRYDPGIRGSVSCRPSGSWWGGGRGPWARSAPATAGCRTPQPSGYRRPVLPAAPPTGGRRRFEAGDKEARHAVRRSNRGRKTAGR